MSESFIFGIHSVKAALQQAGSVQQIWLQEIGKNDRLQQCRDMARQQGIMITTATHAELDALAQGGRHQGVVAQIISTAGVLSLEALLAECERPFLLILDGVQDPHNLGACLRTADAAGVDAVIAPRDKAVGITPVVRKVACGAAETVPFIQVTNLARSMRTLQQHGVWLIGTEAEATQTLYEVDLTGSVALVMGAEGQGLRRLTREHCDHLVSLPMAGQVSSLNVSVATGIALFEAVRQRQLSC